MGSLMNLKVNCFVPLSHRENEMLRQKKLLKRLVPY
ncbi:unnamed protein product [Onchocerca flexuosa]|uniref:Transcriptional regulator n=1 Tax=Onchocerca flexuosa TaxID=387005 RepID=A0A183HX12_9BILA|nr:unnamed protein product [Onchocerca flexuosa]